MQHKSTPIIFLAYGTHLQGEKRVCPGRLGRVASLCVSSSFWWVSASASAGLAWPPRFSFLQWRGLADALVRLPLGLLRRLRLVLFFLFLLLLCVFLVTI
jgi:hypothetical protein